MVALSKAERRQRQVEQLLSAHGECSVEPMALKAYFEASTCEVIVEFSNGSKFIFPAKNAQGLEEAEIEHLEKVELVPGGGALRWDELDVDLSIPHLMEGFFGTKKWMKEQASKGGRSTSEAKKAAAQKNGKKGGRPRKSKKVAAKSLVEV